MHDWEERVIPGLLQTRDYARAVIRAGFRKASQEKINELVDTRIARQGILVRDNPPMTWFVVDQAVLYRPFGGKLVMRDQLLRLEDAASQPNIVIQVIRFSDVEHPGAEGPLRIMEFSDNSPIWYTEGWSSGRMTDARDEVAAATENFNLIRASALSPGESVRFIGKIRVARYE